MASKSQKIVVCGDAAIDVLQWEYKPESSHNSCDNPHHNWQLYTGYHTKKIRGGSLLLAQMVHAACSVDIISQQIDTIDTIPPEKVIHSLAILDKYPLTPDNKIPKNNVYRVKQFCGFSGPSGTPPLPLKIQNDDRRAKLVILDDTGNGFRDKASVWPLSIKPGKTSPIILLKMSRPLATGDLWDQVSQNHAKKLVVIISANDLRECEVNISHGLSWERTAEDFMWQITNNPDKSIKKLANCSNLIVRFGLDGAIWYSNNNGKKKAKLFYYPHYAEDGFKDQYKDQYKCDMQGITIAFVAALSAQIAQANLAGIEKGIQEGMKKSRALFTLGFDKDPESGYPLAELFAKNQDDISFIADISISELNNHRSSHKKPWTILDSHTGSQLETVVYNMVVDGTDPSLQDVPEGKFGNLRTIERTEIESFQSIKNLMLEFLERKDQKAPLSIAVFGPPGSGKSYGVTQLAESIAPGKIKKIEFNISQFKSVSDLISAFHKVRDLVLKGQIPLVFFDEFDSSYDQNFLGWLKYFLALMQDGEFKEGETVHPIGKSIFVFAGGTSSTFEEFSRDDGFGTVKKADKEQFRKAKGTDFISRLRGYVNIMGPNKNGKDDEFYVIRRALLFRSFLEKSAPAIFDSNKKAWIDPGVLRALITIPEYKHGVRSMMAILDMSRLKERRVFEQAALPSEEQLDLHVDGNLFIRLAQKDVLINDTIEKLALSIHKQYCTEHKTKKASGDPSLQSWNKLSDTMKQPYFDQAKELQKQLVNAGYDFDLHLTSSDSSTKLSQTKNMMQVKKDPKTEKLLGLIDSAGIKIYQISGKNNS